MPYKIKVGAFWYANWSISTGTPEFTLKESSAHVFSDDEPDNCRAYASMMNGTVFDEKGVEVSWSDLAKRDLAKRKSTVPADMWMAEYLADILEANYIPRHLIVDFKVAFKGAEAFVGDRLGGIPVFLGFTGFPDRDFANRLVFCFYLRYAGDDSDNEGYNKWLRVPYGHLITPTVRLLSNRLYDMQWSSSNREFAVRHGSPIKVFEEPDERTEEEIEALHTEWCNRHKAWPRPQKVSQEQVRKYLDQQSLLRTPLPRAPRKMKLQ